MNTQSNFMMCRERVYNESSREFLLARISGSEQENDLSVPPNCNGYGRIRHFKRFLDTDWYDPLPMDPMSKSLTISYEDMVKAQVFQLASCNLHCWYCFVPDSLKVGQTTSTSWFTAEQMIKMFAEEYPSGLRLLDLSGGNPELSPEWLIDTMRALEKIGLEDHVYLWSDDTLTTDYFFKYLDKYEIQYIKDYPHYGKVGCFKGFDEESFAFNANLDSRLFEKQFELFKRYLDVGLDIYGYVTFTTKNIDGIDAKINNFIKRLCNIHPLLPLRIIPLKIVMFSPVEHRMLSSHEIAMKNQILVHEEWRKQLCSIFSYEQRMLKICDIPLF